MATSPNSTAPAASGELQKEIHVNTDGSITFLDRTNFLNRGSNSAQGSTTDFAALKQIETLDLHIHADSSANICKVQDALFTLLASPQPGHKMHTLNVSISVAMSHDDDWAMFSSNYAERMYSVSTMREFRDISPGELSRPHLTAFLTDPLRTIRGLRNGNKQGKFTLDFTGKGGQPWCHIKREIFDLIKGDSPVPNYKIFCPYYESLWALLDWCSAHGIKELRKSVHLSRLSGERIRGAMYRFHLQHGAFSDEARQAIHAEVEQGRLSAFDKAEGLRLVHNLHIKLPAVDSSTSFFGYNLADAALREWQETGREEAKAAKEKRKREREAEGETKSRKKTRIM